MDGAASLLSGFDASDRRGAGPVQSVARLRPRALGTDTRSCDRTPARRDDDRRDALHRSDALSRGTFFKLTRVGLMPRWLALRQDFAELIAPANGDVEECTFG